MTTAPESDKQSEPPEDKAGSEFDYSKVDPEKELICFGEIDPENEECKTCPWKEDCKTKSDEGKA